MPDPQNVPLPRIAILGVGSMGRAILDGLTSPDVVGAGIAVTTRSAKSAEALLGLPGVQVMSTEKDPDANRSAARNAAVVVLAVKPAQLLDLAAEIASALRPDAVVVSVAAGVPIAALERALPGIAVVRAMPNTPATVGLGVTGVSAGTSADDLQTGLVEGVFSTIGSVHRVPEEQLDALTAISGSGPAYVFYLVEKLAAAGVALGLDQSLATALAVGTFRGGSELLARSGEAPETLRRKVTSPKGTTEQAIGVFDARDVAGILEEATAAASRRSHELAKQYGTD